MLLLLSCSKSTNTNIFRLTRVELRIGLKNFKGVFAHVWFKKAMTSARLSFTLVEIDKTYLLTLPRWKHLCHRRSCDQPEPGSFFQQQGRHRIESLGTRLMP